MRHSIFCIVYLLFCSVATPLAANALDGQTLIVSAAASLTNAFNEIGDRFHSVNPGTKVVFNFGASGALLQQIDNGAPVDLFASADQMTMDQAAQKGLIISGTRKNFASNELVLITNRHHKTPIAALTDLTGKQIETIALGNPETVPAGRYAREALISGGLWEQLKAKFIFGESVRQVLDYVSRGEVDAGFVFATDAEVAKDRVSVALRAGTQNPITYPISIVSSTKNDEGARQFIDFVLSDQGREILSKYGFNKP